MTSAARKKPRLSTSNGQLVRDANELRADIVEEELRKASGSFQAMGDAMGFSRQRAYNLAKRHDLWELAKDLRDAAGLPTRGPQRQG